jgi:hypothetical protein
MHNRNNPEIKSASDGVGERRVDISEPTERGDARCEARFLIYATDPD